MKPWIGFNQLNTRRHCLNWWCLFFYFKQTKDPIDSQDHQKPDDTFICSIHAIAFVGTVFESENNAFTIVLKNLYAIDESMSHYTTIAAELLQECIKKRGLPLKTTAVLSHITVLD